MKLSLTSEIFILIALLFGIQSALLYYQSEEMIEDILLDESRKQAQTFLHGLEREINSFSSIHDKVLLRQKVSRALSQFEKFSQFHEVNFSIYRLYIFDAKGEILADSHQKYDTRKNVSEYLEPVFQQQHSLVSKEIEYKPGREIKGKLVSITDVIIPLYENNQVVAALEIEINIEKTLNNIKMIDGQYDTRMTIIISLSGLLLVLSLGYFLHRRLIAPILKIEQTARDITQENFSSRINKINAPKEITHLGQSIDSMAGSIQDFINSKNQSYIEVINSLTRALHAKDDYTAQHSSRVSAFSVKLGKYFKLSKEDLALLKQGALMHDLGKIAIPDKILNKESPLTDEEFAIMREHPVKTAEILKPLLHYEHHREIAAWHHERWDGKGYPDGLKGEDIPFMARIVSIADTWDAMTGDRCYRKGMSKEKALSIIRTERDSGQWDPQMVDAVLEIIKI
ncbi:HD-GYP domain-containing protein [sulfur-oxidizing endosymbiont of Gigantopelta aegis]|uniref:HD-GYP domain-containing protein n=1 Tax=sulfur-oxidizing endosymbiont of Gigantopelta aegis TaxID=2794934 RepID=UPI0018DDC2E9|nr:HD domain-containing phosphohydrolase [sulfur-oxidizing endosymbiont of Gigantopelta aegis]